MADDKTLAIPFSPELIAKIAKFKADWYQHYKKVSKEKTPLYDGLGRQVIKKRPDGKDYIEDAWITDRLNKHFPGWSWEAAAPLQFLGAEWVVAQGHLCIIDERLLAFGISPIRKFYGVDAVRIQYRTCSCQGKNPNCVICKGSGKMPHTPENIIDVGDNCQSAVTGAKKRATNRLTGIGDDIYGKRIEEEGAGTEEEIMQRNDTAATDVQARTFGKFLSENHIPVSEALKTLNVKSMSEIKDFKEAYNRIKESKEVDSKQKD